MKKNLTTVEILDTVQMNSDGSLLALIRPLAKQDPFALNPLYVATTETSLFLNAATDPVSGNIKIHDSDSNILIPKGTKLDLMQCDPRLGDSLAFVKIHGHVTLGVVQLVDVAIVEDDLAGIEP